ncbi:MAG: DUF177 domain-containing protein [Butyrivibrio sp.]|nr:DUF177 domain-containing protein [Butyrivibrio sp.]
MILDLSDMFPDGARPFRVSGAGKGAQRKYTVVPDTDRLDLGRVSYPIADKPPIDLYVSRIGKSGIHIEGNVSLTLLVPCDRCLDETEQALSFELDRDIDFEESDGEEDTSFIEGYTIDADGLLFPEIVLNLPTKVLCREDCKGICRVCGANLNRESCGCDAFVPDPRMAAIKDIFQNSLNK